MKWVFIVEQLNTHKSASLVEWVAKQCKYQGCLGKKGVSGIDQNMKTRALFLQDNSHKIRFVYTPKHASWRFSNRVLVFYFSQKINQKK